MESPKITPIEPPEHWKIRECKDYPGRCYYYSELYNKSTWNKPNTIPEYVYIFQILLKHKDSICPYTKDGEVLRTKEEALELITEFRNQLVSDIASLPLSFMDMANDVSDAVDGDDSGGCMGWVNKKQVPESFAEAVWKLEIGDVSEVIETPLGLHLIYRMG
ncbi:Peptidyl-prolyl cis-trans isomerase pin1 [Histomonas meleagridis]|uniref:Peptidyl-prolyl cis-trans isomerase pin1 n=1 Tax=Histomonas meleagridis TaxID=135588 RepID=UPI00355A94E5|nr:Peptidyl-prolyl cis-trans isomerase pin1 [Histomonas meleagridis]KAH0806292.1 Peptidyl-prolyl cis-trans isomerase pin1 [Histomonas meleagridis]